MTKKLDPAVLKLFDEADYSVAMFPGGGQRGYATALLLEFFEKVTGLPTLHLFPHVVASSVGVMHLAALYLRHPERHDAVRMSARQLVEIFPKIAARLPEEIALIRDKKESASDPLMEAVSMLVNGARLGDFLGTVSVSTHKIEGDVNSFVAFEQFIHPVTGEKTYSRNVEGQEDDRNVRLMSIIRKATALPIIYTDDEDHIDISFASPSSTFLLELSRLMGSDRKGAFTFVGNFRRTFNEKAQHIKTGGLFKYIIAIIDEIDNHVYSNTIKFAEKIFYGHLIDLEQKITRDMNDAPDVTGNISTPEQFAKIRAMTDAFIAENRDVLTALALRLKDIALARLESNPTLAFGIIPETQEFALPEIPEYIRPTPIRDGFASAAGATANATKVATQFTMKGAWRLATSAPVQVALRTLWGWSAQGLRQLAEKCNLVQPVSNPSLQGQTLE